MLARKTKFKGRFGLVNAGPKGHVECQWKWACKCSHAPDCSAARDDRRREQVLTFAAKHFVGIRQDWRSRDIHDYLARTELSIGNVLDNEWNADDTMQNYSREYYERRVPISTLSQSCTGRSVDHALTLDHLTNGPTAARNSSFIRLTSNADGAMTCISARHLSQAKVSI